MFYKMDTSNVESLQYYSTKISTIASVASIFGPWIGVYISSYSMLSYRPKRVILYPIYALIHASIWLVLCYSFANMVILWKYRVAFPAKWPLHTCVNAFVDFYIYALLLLFVIHVSIWLYDKYTNSGLTNRSTRTLPPQATSSSTRSDFSSPPSAPQSAPPVNSIR
jgi:hypothetical protein